MTVHLQPVLFFCLSVSLSSLSFCVSSLRIYIYLVFLEQSVLVSPPQDSMAMTGGTVAPLPMSNHTRERVTVAKLTLENFYSTLLTQHEEREMRY